MKKFEMLTNLRLSGQPGAGVVEIHLVLGVEHRVLGASKCVERCGCLIIGKLLDISDVSHSYLDRSTGPCDSMNRVSSELRGKSTVRL